MGRGIGYSRVWGDYPYVIVDTSNFGYEEAETEEELLEHFEPHEIFETYNGNYGAVDYDFAQWEWENLKTEIFTAFDLHELSHSRKRYWREYVDIDPYAMRDLSVLGENDRLMILVDSSGEQPALIAYPQRYVSGGGYGREKEYNIHREAARAFNKLIKNSYAVFLRDTSSWTTRKLEKYS